MNGGRWMECARWISLVAVLAACSDSEDKRGQKGEECLPDNTCQAGLECIAGFCEEGNQSGPDAAVGDPADAGPVGDPMVGEVPEFTSGNPRRGAAVVELPDGRVLVAGGIVPLDVVEIYDLDAKTIELVDPLNEGRRYASAVLLPDGTVLIVGGSGPDTDGTAAEIFDPSDGSATLLPARMGSARSLPGTWLLSSGPNAGKVLIVGGAALGAPELFDPSTNTFSPLGATNAPALFPGVPVRLPDGRVMLVGGTSPDMTTFRECYIYDPEAGAFTQVASMLTDRNRYAPIGLQDGRVLIAGGFDDPTGAANQAIEMFDPSTGEMTTLAATMDGPRYSHAIALLGSGRVAVISGVAAPSDLLATVEIFDPATDTFFDAIGEVSQARANASALTLSDGRIFVLGGQVVVGINLFDTSAVDVISE